MTTHSPDTYTVTCSPQLMTDDELRRAIGRAWNGYSRMINAEAAETYKREYERLMQEKLDRGARIRNMAS